MLSDKPDMRSGHVEIEYCTRCGFLARATWTAQELLDSFGAQLCSVKLVPGARGIFEVRLDGEVLASRRMDGVYPEPLALKRLIRDRLCLDQAVGHEREGR